MELFAKIGRKLVRDPQIRQMIARGKKPYWERNKWCWNSGKTVLEGRFRTPYCAPKGKFARHHDGTFTAYIIDPPEKLWSHRESRCFYAEPDKDVYRVHFITSPQNHTIDACIQRVERILVESFETRR
jgi:hypothetical protein